MEQQVLVVGASGAQGGPVARRLAAAGHRVLGLTRGGHAEALSAVGVTPVRADLADPASLATVVRETGVRAAFLHAPMSLGPDGPRPALEALLDAGIERLVFNTGMALPPAPVGNPRLDGQIATVNWLLGSGRATVLVPTGYLENFSAPWSAPRVAAGELLYPRPADDLVAWVTNEDVATATEAVLRTPAAIGRRLPLAGPQALTFTDVAAGLAEALGRPVAFRQITGGEYGQLVGTVLGPQVGALIGMAYDSMPPGRNPLMTPDTTETRELLGIEFTSLVDWARRQEWPTA
ncbi:SDR family oxidoreductase [Micromonospora sp. BQ11]|uniref:SDR family oxidoreductase n=1 Tax=Micromonospora sp. BQ11 TaxID=3452212 RepID=UPI003F8C10F9